jgi:hypothetical protein
MDLPSVDRKFEPLTESEHEWIGEQLTRARDFAREFDPEARYGEATLDSLDRAFRHYLDTERDSSRANDVVLAVGVVFGSALIAGLGFQWVISTDDFGTDLAVLARPGRGDVTIFPADFVSKRYERREAPFLVSAFSEIQQSLRDIAAEWGETV